jgi:hypothetical protein
VVGLGVGWTLWQARHGLSERWAIHQPRGDLWPRTPWKNARPDVKYVGDAACARCHEDIAATFRRHPMGRSLAPIASAPTVGGDPSGGSITFEVQGERGSVRAGQTEAALSQFTVERRDGREFHRETRRDAQGRILAQVEAEVKYALGSGSRGVSYLVEHDGRLFQSPISWYRQKGTWDLSPGYERRNHHFERPIEPQCLFCHANRVEPVERSINRYAEPIFRGHAIGCERCHGPGELHVRRPELVEGRDVTIVNPRHLEPTLRAAVCEQCHLLGDHRIERLGRDPFDYRPGLPTSAFFAVYDRVDQAGNKAVGHVQQMKTSRCFRASRGRLGCTSCHDPHQVPAPAEKTAYFRQQCLACHQRQGCSLPEPIRLARSGDDNCIQCHMPMSSSADIVHVATTDHRILRTPQGPGSEPAGTVPGAGLPLILLNGGQLGSEELQSLGRERALALMAEGRGLPDTPPVRRMGSLALSLLDRALAKRPDDLVVQRAKAQALALAGRLKEAIQLDESVLRSSPSYEQALDDCMSYAIELGDIRAALEPARQAVAVNPWCAAFHERLAYVSLQSRDWSGALRESRAALRLNPVLRFARRFEVQCLLYEKDFQTAEEKFTTLIQLNPSEHESLQRWFAEQRRSSGG